VPPAILASRPIYYGLFHSLAVVFNLEFMWSLTAVYSAEFAIAFFILTCGATKTYFSSKSPALVTAAAATMLFFTSFLVVYHYFYINHHMTVAAHFTLFFMLAWHGLREGEDTFALLAVFVLIPSLMMRIENPIYVIAFSGLLLCQRSLSRSTASAVGVLAGLSVLVHGCIMSFLMNGPFGGITTSNRTLLMAFFGLLLLVLGWLWRMPRFSVISEKCCRYGDRAIPIVFATLVIALTCLEFQRIWHSFVVTLANMLHYGEWHGLWLGIFCLIGALFVCPMKPIAGETFLRGGISVFLLSLFVFLGFRSSYLLSVFDSANRMLIHIAPTVVFYLTVKFAENAYLTPKWRDTATC